MTRTQLENGLKVVVESDPAAAVVALQLWVEAGAADERPGEEGLAHLHEHMLFKGTARRGPGEVAAAVEALGGEINAWTSHDRTVYHLTVPAGLFAQGLDVLADAVTGSVFDPDELARETEVVCEEIKRGDDDPTRLAQRALMALTFRHHPYGRPVIGSEQSVRALDRTAILDFYARHYTTGRMTLAVAGAVEPDEVLRAAQEAFAGARTGRVERVATRHVEPPPEGLRLEVREAPIAEMRLMVGFPVPPLGHPDVPALDLLAAVLGQGEASVLDQKLRVERSVVNDVAASAWTPQEDGLFLVSATMVTAQLEAAIGGIWRELQSACLKAPDAAALRRVQRQLEIDRVFQRETVQGRARRLGFYESGMGGVEAEAAYLEQALACDAESLRQVARRYLLPESMRLLVVSPPGEAPSEETVRGWLASARFPKPLWELVTPETSLRGASTHTTSTSTTSASTTSASTTSTSAGRRSTARSGEILVEQLPGGVTLVVRPERAVPLLSLRAAWRGGILREGDASTGIGSLLARTHLRATQQRDTRAVAEEIDALGGGFSAQSGRNSYGLQGSFLSADLERGLGFFSELLWRPALHEDDVARERALQLEDLRTRDDHPAGVAISLFLEGLYTAHPYRLEQEGTTAVVASLESAQLRAHLERHYGTAGLVIAAAGDVDPEQLRALLEPHLAAARAGAAVGDDPPHDPPPPGVVQRHRSLPRRQAHLVYGFRGTTLDAPDRAAAQLLAAVLGGQGGRLFADLRDKQSLAYSVSAFSGEGLAPGHFAVYIGTSPDKVAAAREGIQRHLQRLCDDRVPMAELERARRQLVGGHVRGLQRQATRAGVMALDACYGLGADFHLGQEARLQAVTPASLQEAAQRLFDFDRRVEALVSPEAQGA